MPANQYTASTTGAFCFIYQNIIRLIFHGKQRKALDTGRKNVKTDASTWQRIENVHEPIIDPFSCFFSKFNLS